MILSRPVVYHTRRAAVIGRSATGSEQFTSPTMSPYALLRLL